MADPFKLNAGKYRKIGEVNGASRDVEIDPALLAALGTAAAVGAQPEQAPAPVYLSPEVEQDQEHAAPVHVEPARASEATIEVPRAAPTLDSNPSRDAIAAAVAAALRDPATLAAAARAAGLKIEAPPERKPERAAEIVADPHGKGNVVIRGWRQRYTVTLWPSQIDDLTGGRSPEDLRRSGLVMLARLADAAAGLPRKAIKE